MTANLEIKVGGIAIGKKPQKIRTLGIGSCAVVILYDKKNKIGGMVHSMLPSRSDEEKMAGKFGNDIRYVDEAIECLARKIQEKGGVKEYLAAKLVGGASMFKNLNNFKLSIGSRNIDCAREKLKNLGIPLENEDVGGSVGRIAELNTSNGIVNITIKI